MRKVYRFPIPMEGSFTLQLPFFSEILTVHVDRRENGPVIYCLCDIMNHRVERKFRMYGTGAEQFDQSKDQRYIGTFEVVYPAGGIFIGHLFEVL